MKRSITLLSLSFLALTGLAVYSAETETISAPTAEVQKAPSKKEQRKLARSQRKTTKGSISPRSASSRSGSKAKQTEPEAKAYEIDNNRQAKPALTEPETTNTVESTKETEGL
jgi:hypothetical protein